MAETWRTVEPNFRIMFRSKLSSAFDYSLTSLVLGQGIRNALLWEAESKFAASALEALSSEKLTLRLFTMIGAAQYP